MKTFKIVSRRKRNIFRPRMAPDILLYLTERSKNPCIIRKREKRIWGLLNYTNSKPRDGTTPAESFFGTKAREMFDFLLRSINLPGGRPAKPRA
ncbi:hypothetical protein [Desulfobacter sp.]|uniref:hypothetical protein n=1 Tax=Desulfobacter sp. TaxID=2294 RepID=UPI003D0CEFD9